MISRNLATALTLSLALTSAVAAPDEMALNAAPVPMGPDPNILGRPPGKRRRRNEEQDRAAKKRRKTAAKARARNR